MTANGAAPYRIKSGDNRQANSPLYPTAVTLNYDRQTKAYTLLSTGEGLSESQIIHCLKQYHVAREVFSGIQSSAEIARRAIDIHKSNIQTEPASRGWSCRAPIRCSNSKPV